MFVYKHVEYGIYYLYAWAKYLQLPKNDPNEKKMNAQSILFKIGLWSIKNTNKNGFEWSSYDW